MAELSVLTEPLNQKSNHDLRIKSEICSVVWRIRADPGSTLSLRSIVKVVLMWRSFRFSWEAARFSTSQHLEFYTMVIHRQSYSRSCWMNSWPWRGENLAERRSNKLSTGCFSRYLHRLISRAVTAPDRCRQRERWPSVLVSTTGIVALCRDSLSPDRASVQAFTLLIHKFVVCSRWRRWVSISDLTHGSSRVADDLWKGLMLLNCMWPLADHHLQSES